MSYINWEVELDIHELTEAILDQIGYGGGAAKYIIEILESYSGNHAQEDVYKYLKDALGEPEPESLDEIVENFVEQVKAFMAKNVRKEVLAELAKQAEAADAAALAKK